MASNNLSNKNLLNSVIDDLSPTWSKRISSASQNYWELQKTLITSDSYAPARNEVIAALINRIGLTTLATLEARNPFKSLWRSDGLVYGDTIQEMEVDNAKERKFKNITDPVDQFKPVEMGVNSAYHKVNRESQYSISLPGPQLKRAFVDEGGLSQLLSQFISALYSGNEIDSAIYAKEMITTAYNNKEVGIKKDQFATVGELNIDSTAEEVRRFLFNIKNILSAMTFNSNKYKPSDVLKAYSQRDFMMFLDYRYSNLNNIQNMPTLFTPSYNSLGIQEVLVDDFGEGGDNICGVICHKRAFNIKTIQDVTTTADNAASLYQNWFRSIFEIYWMSPYYPVVFLTKKS